MIKISKIKEKNLVRINELMDNLKQLNERISTSYKDFQEENNLMFDIKYILRELELLYRNVTNTRIKRRFSEEQLKEYANIMKKNRYTKK